MPPASATPSARQPACSWAPLCTLALLAAVVLVLGGCAATPSGSEGADAFASEAEPLRLSGPRAAADAAQCFVEQGRFLPLLEFSSDSAAGRYTYHLEHPR